MWVGSDKRTIRKIFSAKHSETCADDSGSTSEKRQDGVSGDVRSFHWCSGYWIFYWMNQLISDISELRGVVGRRQGSWVGIENTAGTGERRPKVVPDESGTRQKTGRNRRSGNVICAYFPVLNIFFRRHHVLPAQPPIPPDPDPPSTTKSAEVRIDESPPMSLASSTIPSDIIQGSPEVTQRDPVKWVLCPLD